MSKSWPKIIRDPVHNLIPFQDTKCDRLLLDLINTREFQRLRRIKQLGMSEFVFPGANHSRFAHSIGVMHLARQFLNRLDQLGEKIGEEQQTIVLSAALLHDLGHGPFSHAFEKITHENHEKRTLEIIQETSTEVNKKLREWDRKLPDHLVQFFDQNVGGKGTLPPYLVGIVSSRMDADRFDYLIRDGYATGTNYGKFDPNWLILHSYPDKKNGRLYLGNKALMATEAYIFARHHMYQSVYFHKTTRAAEVALRLLFKRFKERLDAGSKKEKAALTPGAPASVVEAFAGKINLGTFLRLDDHSITEFVKSCEFSGDEVLKRLGSSLLNRHLLKSVDATEANGDQVANFKADALALFKKHRSLNADFQFADDTPGDTPYKPYDFEQERPSSMIWVEDLSGKQHELSQLSDQVLALRKKKTLVRYYFPEVLRDEIKVLAVKHLGKVAS